MARALHVLIVEDSEDDTKLILEELNDRGYHPIHRRIETPEEMKEALRQGRWDLVLSDYVMPRFNALEAMRLIREEGLDIPFIIITGSIGEETAVAAMKAGAHDYLMKDNLSRLSPAIERELQDAERRRAHRGAEVALQQSEERFRQMAESIQEIFWMRDLEKNKILYVSPSYEKIWGRSCRSLYEEPASFIESIYPEDRPQVLAAMKKIPFELGELEYRIVHPDGSIRWIRDRAFPIRNEKGEIYRISGVAEEITKRKRAEEELMRSRQQLRNLAARLESVREMERAWISREIHDELGQIFTSVKYEIALSRKLAEKIGGLAAEGRSSLDEKLLSALNLVEGAIKTVRRIATELRPGILDDLGLMAALEWQASEFQQRTGIDCRLRSDLQEIRLNREGATAVFRIIQEILTNIARHSGATQVQIRIKEKEGNLLLEIKDNGRGISEEEISDPKSLGLLGMRERALLLGGETRISGTPHKGTQINVKIPLENPIEEEGDAAFPTSR